MCACVRSPSCSVAAGTGGRSCRSSGGPPPLRRRTVCPRGRRGMAAGPSCSKRGLRIGSSQSRARPVHLAETKAQGPGLALRAGAWASFDWQRLGPPSPACLLPGLWLPGRGCGAHRPCLGCPLASPQKRPGPAHLPSCRTWEQVSARVLAPRARLTPSTRSQPPRKQWWPQSGAERGARPQPRPVAAWSQVSRAWERGAAHGTCQEVAHRVPLLRGRGGQAGGRGGPPGFPSQAPGPHQDPSSGLLRGTVSCS